MSLIRAAELARPAPAADYAVSRRWPVQAAVCRTPIPALPPQWAIFERADRWQITGWLDGGDYLAWPAPDLRLSWSEPVTSPALLAVLDEAGTP